MVFEGSTGKLTIDTPSSFTGVISGFTGDGTLAGSDQIDLKGINYNSSHFTESFDAADDTLFVSDGTHSATLHFNGTYQAANFKFTTDNSGGTIVYDPPVAGQRGCERGRQYAAGEQQRPWLRVQLCRQRSWTCRPATIRPAIPICSTARPS